MRAIIVLPSAATLCGAAMGEEKKRSTGIRPPIRLLTEFVKRGGCKRGSR